LLHEQEVLPLPSVNTIRRHLTLSKTSCGFDTKFFMLLEKKLKSMNDLEKHGILVFDEIFLRESVEVNTNSLTYSGLVDFGGDNIDTQHSGEKADRGLVFLFQSLGCSFSQPIGVFVSKGNVKGYYFNNNYYLCLKISFYFLYCYINS